MRCNNYLFKLNYRRSLECLTFYVMFDIFFPYVTNGLSHPYQMDQSIFILRCIGSNFSFLFHFSMKIKSANRIAPDWMPRIAASHLGLFCLPMSHIKDARLILVKVLMHCILIPSYT